jgi:DNA-binding transcriptional LysR family regulator
LDIKQIKYFLAIAEEGQITNAAKKLNMAQPPLSYQLKMLEQELGVKLVERGSRKIRLTEAGKLLKIKGEKILELEKATVMQIKDLGDKAIKTLSIGVVSSSASALLPSPINKFHEDNKEVNFELWEGNTYRILEMLESELIEVGIVRTPFNIDDYQYKYLSCEPMIAVFNDNFLKYNLDYKLSISALEKLPLIIYRRFESLIMKCFDNNNIEANIICRCDDARTALLWANSGIGITLAPKTAINLVNNSNLKYVELTEDNLETRVTAIWLKNKYLSKQAYNFLRTFDNK